VLLDRLLEESDGKLQRPSWRMFRHMNHSSAGADRPAFRQWRHEGSLADDAETIHRGVAQRMTRTAGNETPML
jgi:hypothetical protein